LFFKKLQRLGVTGIRGFEGTFEDVGKQKAALLEFSEDGVAGLPFPGDLQGAEQTAGFSLKATFGGVQEASFRWWGDPAQEEGMDVDWTIAGGPFEPLEAAGEVFGRRGLATTVTGECC
jgi:hypothetical protein